MNEIVLPSFKLEKFDVTKSEHLMLIKRFEFDSDVKKRLYPYKDSFYDLITDNIKSSTIFHSFYVIWFEERIIGYTEIESPRKTFINAAFLKEERSKGFGTRFLRELADYLLANYQEQIESVNTIVHSDNIGSIKNCLKSGFTQVPYKDSNYQTFTRGR